MIRILRKGKIFTVCFVVDRDRKLFLDADDVRRGLDKSIEMMMNWSNADECEETIKKTRIFRQELNKKNVNINLVANIITSAMFASYITYLISKYSSPKSIGWMPDRDSITDSFNGIAHTIYSINSSAFCQRSSISVPIIGICTQNDADLWCDPYIRVADYVAGAAAAWDPPTNDKVPEKIAVLIKEAFSDNKYLYLFRVAFSVTKNSRFGCRVSRIGISRSQRFGRRFSKSMISLRGISREIAESDEIIIDSEETDISC
jgi:hypothetical protein